MISVNNTQNIYLVMNYIKVQSFYSFATCEIKVSLLTGSHSSMYKYVLSMH